MLPTIKNKLIGIREDELTHLTYGYAGFQCKRETRALQAVRENVKERIRKGAEIHLYMEDIDA